MTGIQRFTIFSVALFTAYKPIKIFGILGLLLGPIGVLNNIFMSCMLGSLVGVVLIATKKMDRSSHFAFGPFIIITAAVQIFVPELVEYINPLYIK